MSSRRPVILMGILLVLLLGYVCWSGSYPGYNSSYGPLPSDLPPLPGENAISGLTVRQIKENCPPPADRCENLDRAVRRRGSLFADNSSGYTARPP
jgi:hypothetical protein